MKRMLKLVLVLIMFIPLVAKADMGAPMVRSYEAVVIKEEGIDYIQTYGDAKEVKGHLDKDDVVTITYEYVENGETFLSFEKNYESFSIKASDVLPVEKEVKPTDKNVDKLESSVKLRIEANEVVVRKGPSVVYDKKGTLKKGTTATYKYYIADSSYVYIETDSLSGWVDRLDRAVLSEAHNTIVVGKSLSTKCGTIPANTKFTSSWEALNWDSISHEDGTSLVVYKGCDTFIPTFHNDNVAVDYATRDYVIKTTKEIKVYETKEFKKVSGTIPANVKIDVAANPNYTGPSDTYLEYKNIKGWIPANDTGDYSLKYIPKSEYKEEEAKEDEKPVEESKEEEPKEEKPAEEPKEKEDKKEDKKEKKSLDTMTIVLICVIVGLAIALAALVTILLINANKKKALAAEEAKEAEKEKEEAYEEELAEKNIALAEEYEAEEKANDVEKTAKHAKKD